MKACVKYRNDKIVRDPNCRTCSVKKSKVVNQLKIKVLELEAELLKHKKGAETVPERPIRRHTYSFDAESMF